LLNASICLGFCLVITGTVVSMVSFCFMSSMVEPVINLKLQSVQFLRAEPGFLSYRSFSLVLWFGIRFDMIFAYLNLIDLNKYLFLYKK
jgi:hypothetical protein